MSEKLIYPRSLAVRVLTRVLSEHQPLDEVLAEMSNGLSPSVSAWLQEVCAGTLRWKGRLDSILDSIALKKKPSGWLRKILLLASYQLVAQDRTHAGLVVSETVSEVKSKEGNAPAQFANACLRKVAEHAQQWRNQEFPEGYETKDCAAWASLPDWLWIKLTKQNNLNWAASFARASLERPVLWIRARDLAWAPSWAQGGPIPGSWQVSEGGWIAERAEFKAGEIFVQDISSQTLIYEVTARVRQDLGLGKLTALDLCAAPGGKSLGLAWNGFQVMATDRVEKRIPLLQQTVSRTGADIQVVSWDEAQKNLDQDLVWIDAPCSGTGILRRHPDVRWLRQEKELSGLMKAQQELLQETWKQIPSGRYLAYSVCSVLQEEGIGAIKKVGLQEYICGEWFLCPQISPSGDGFWAALLKKQ